LGKKYSEYPSAEKIELSIFILAQNFESARIVFTGAVAIQRPTAGYEEARLRGDCCSLANHEEARGNIRAYICQLSN
jgi:hypothetical protein